MKCWYDDNITCLDDCELIENCKDRERMLEIREEVIEESVERVDRLMINTVCNPLISTREEIDVYLQCIRDAKKAIRGESDDN